MRLVLLLVLLCTLAVPQCAQRSAHEAALGKKRAISTCCDPVGGNRDNAERQLHDAKTCGANGYGYRWFELRSFAGEVDQEMDKASYQLILLTAAGFWLGTPLVANYSWDMFLSFVFAGLSTIGTCLTQFLCRKLLFLSPLGWMRVSNVFTLYYVCSLILSYELNVPMQSDDRKQARGSMERYGELARYGIFAVIVFAQEKLLWRPELSNVIPVAVAFYIILLQNWVGVRKSVLSGLVGGVSIICFADPFIRTTDANANANANADADGNQSMLVVDAAGRLYMSTMWPVFVIPLCIMYSYFRVERYRLCFAGVISVYVTAFALRDRMPTSETNFYFRRFGMEDGFGRWCCMDATERSHCDVSLKSRTWFHHNERDEQLLSMETWAMMIITVFTNASGLPAAWYFFNVGNAYVAVVGCCTIAFSTLYHLADTIDDQFWGMTEGNWHRLDNIFAILSFVNLQIYILDATITIPARELVRTFFICCTVLLQEIGPWQLECTLIPIFLATIFHAAYLRSHQDVALALRKGTREGDFTKGLILIVLGIMGFIKGLEQETDYLRLGHGCWHFFTGLAFFYLSKGFHEIILKTSEKLNKQV